MSVRPTQTKSGYPRRSRQPYPSAGSEPAGEPDRIPDAGLGGGSVGTEHPEERPAEPTLPVSRADRKTQREARRIRRNLALACGLVVAVCLVLTILIVNMARTRPYGLAALPRSDPSAAGPLPVPTHPAIPNRAAPAAEGGNR